MCLPHALHLLTDRVHQLNQYTDELNENYQLTAVFIPVHLIRELLSQEHTVKLC